MQELDELERVYRAGFPTFLRVATAITRDEQLARDAVHDGFVRAVRHRRRFRGQGSLEAWVWRIVVNEARKRRRGAARAIPVDPARLPDVAATNGRPDGADVGALIAALPDRQRLALFLRYYADLDYAAIAEALGVAPGTVAAALHAARAALRTQLQEAR